MATKSKKQTKLIFSPEALAYILLQVEYIPGMNSLTDYRREGIEAQRAQETERAKKQEEASSTKEMRPVLKRKATLQEQLEGKGDEYTYVPHVIGLSGADPLASFFVGNAVLNQPLRWLGKGALYGLGRYGTSTLKNWARGKIIGLEMNSLTPTPLLASSNNFISPASWLQDWDGKSGPLLTLGNEAVKKSYLKAKKDLYNYIHGSEFKQRVMNTGRFTELDYKDLIKEIETELLRTKYVGLDQRPGKGGGNEISFSRNIFTDRITRVFGHKIELAPSMSLVLHRANAWHELWHSIAGRDFKFDTKSFPLLSKLQLFNIDINPVLLSKAASRALDRQTLLDYIRTNDPEYMKNWIQPKENFVAAELNKYNWLRLPDISSPAEIRSRMHATLDFLRLRGYNTYELVNNPDKFKKWINELYLLQADIPSDLQLLLLIYNVNDLANYASKVLSVTGAAYTGTSLLNNSNSELNNVNNQTNHR